MRAVRQRGTKAEVAVRRELHRRGLRYRVDYCPLPALRTRADIVFTRQRIAVFVDGCFWHGCPHHWTRPASNTAWWLEKIKGNKGTTPRPRRSHPPGGQWFESGSTSRRVPGRTRIEQVVRG